MANFEAFYWVISSSLNFLFLKSAVESISHEETFSCVTQYFFVAFLHLTSHRHKPATEENNKLNATHHPTSCPKI